MVVVDGEVGINGAGGERARPRRPSCGSSSNPAERHEVVAHTDARLLLLTSWPGDGGPGAMSLRAKFSARRTAARWRAKA